MDGRTPVVTFESIRAALVVLWQGNTVSLDAERCRALGLDPGGFPSPSEIRGRAVDVLVTAILGKQ